VVSRTGQIGNGVCALAVAVELLTCFESTSISAPNRQILASDMAIGHPLSQIGGH